MKKIKIIFLISAVTFLSLFVLACHRQGTFNDRILAGDKNTPAPTDEITPYHESEATATATPAPVHTPVITAVPSPAATSELTEATEPVTEPYTLKFVDVFKEEYETVIDPLLPMHKYKNACFITEEGIKRYEDDSYTSVVGIDVSRYQGEVDFDAVREAGFDFVFIRIGYRGYGKTGSVQKDKEFDRNIKGAVDAGLDVGVYFFSQAINEEEALEEADFVFRALDEYKENNSDEDIKILGIVYDPESILDHEARTDDVTAEQFTLNSIAFLDAVRDEGYEPVLYCNMLWEAFMLEMDRIYDRDYEIWYADYEEYPQTPYEFGYWQYTNEGQVPGVKGNADINIRFVPK